MQRPYERRKKEEGRRRKYFKKGKNNINNYLKSRIVTIFNNI
ncbi:hypothetical protein [Okeania sp. KiyG1]|nr:hypothetical protein [Okeania sp. KiyG1]